MDLNKVFEAIAANMLTSFDGIGSQIPHPVSKGDHREGTLATFLREYLPTRYSISSGQIMDSLGNISQQCDIVIYDSSKCPLLLSSEDQRIFPCEPVLSVIEVKSILSSNKLSEAISNIRSIKQLERSAGPIGGVIFSYRSSWRRKPVDHLAKKIHSANANIPPVEYIDTACILDAGVVSLSSSEGLARIPKDPEDRVIYAFVELDKPILFWFFVNLLDLLDGQVSDFPNYSLYSDGVSIGITYRYPAKPEDAS